MNNKYHEGKIFGRLTAIERLGVYYRCVCQCGHTVVVRTDRLVCGKTKSCGCLAREIKIDLQRDAVIRKKARADASLAARKAQQRTPEEKKLLAVWSSMMQRCHNPRNKDYKNYGARGVSVCARWRDKNLFLEDMQPLYRSGYWIERIDNDLGYAPENCEFTSAKKQACNRRNTLNLWYERKGRDESLAQRCTFHRVTYDTGYRWFSSLRSRGETPTLERFLDELVRGR